ncbi:unnamed protein product [Urochloa humidicola]
MGDASIGWCLISITGWDPCDAVISLFLVYLPDIWCSNYISHCFIQEGPGVGDNKDSSKEEIKPEEAQEAWKQVSWMHFGSMRIEVLGFQSCLRCEFSRPYCEPFQMVQECTVLQAAISTKNTTVSMDTQLLRSSAWREPLLVERTFAEVLHILVY